MSNSKAALITGSAKRIGKQMALELAGKGYDIVISYNSSADDANKLKQEIIDNHAVKCEVFGCDLQDASQAQKLIDFALETFPHLQLLVNNASTFNKSKFLDDGQQLQDNLNLHFISPLILSKEFAKHVQNGQIINMVDKNIARYDTNYFYYLLSKKILAEFTKMLSLELAPAIRVNAIAPGFILNNVNEQNPSDDVVQKSIKRIPLQNKGDVANILQALNFLLDNDFVTGQILFIDGGASLNHAG